MWEEAERYPLTVVSPFVTENPGVLCVRTSFGRIDNVNDSVMGDAVDSGPQELQPGLQERAMNTFTWLPLGTQGNGGRPTPSWRRSHSERRRPTPSIGVPDPGPCAVVSETIPSPASWDGWPSDPTTSS